MLDRLLMVFLLDCLLGVVKEHSLYRDGPISSVKLFSLSSSTPAKTVSGNGKLMIRLYFSNVVSCCNYLLQKS